MHVFIFGGQACENKWLQTELLLEFLHVFYKLTNAVLSVWLHVDSFSFYTLTVFWLHVDSFSFYTVQMSL